MARKVKPRPAVADNAAAMMKNVKPLKKSGKGKKKK